jgi:hypothetical protein
MKYLMDCLTGADNSTLDIGRVLWLAGSLSFIGLAGFDVVKTGHAPDLMSFAQGFALLLAGGGAGLGFKGHTEPKAS